MTTTTVSSRPVRPAPLRRSIPFWVLVAGSVASFGYGGWLVLDKMTTMTATLADGSATGVDVYAGQSWVVVGGAFLTAGLIGLVAALGLAVVPSLVRAFAPAPVVADELGYDAELGYTETVETVDARDATEPEPATAS